MKHLVLFLLLFIGGWVSAQTPVILKYGVIDSTTYDPFITPSNTAKYYFNGYKKMAASSTDSVTEGTTNLFFTAARAAAAAGASTWSLTGNTGTVYKTNFIGTTDTVPIRFRVNNAPIVTIDATSIKIGALTGINGTLSSALTTTSLNFYNTGNSSNTLQFNGSNQFTPLIQSGGATILSPKFITTTIIAGATAQYEPLTFQGGGYSGGSITPTLIFKGSYGSTTTRMTIYDNGSTGAPITILPTDGNLIIGGTNTSDVTSALLNVISTTKGFLPPRMTTTQKNAIATPATGLQVYDTNMGCICTYNGTLWTNAPTISNGTAAPTTTPTKIGDQYVDTTNKKIYFATGTTASTDWTIVN